MTKVQSLFMCISYPSPMVQVSTIAKDFEKYIPLHEGFCKPKATIHCANGVITGFRRRPLLLVKSGLAFIEPFSWRYENVSLGIVIRVGIWGCDIAAAYFGADFFGE